MRCPNEGKRVNRKMLAMNSPKNVHTSHKQHRHTSCQWHKRRSLHFLLKNRAGKRKHQHALNSTQLLINWCALHVRFEITQLRFVHDSVNNLTKQRRPGYSIDPRNENVRDPLLVGFGVGFAVFDGQMLLITLPPMENHTSKEDGVEERQERQTATKR
jgi:hypothetical protein